MNRRTILILSAMVGICLAMTGWLSTVGWRPLLMFVVLAAQIPIAVARLAPMGRGELTRPFRWGYQPRPTDAGQWLDAPIAEVDKSTCGQLLRSRMGREPGLRVVVPGRSSPACSDAMYDAELDG